MWCAHNLSTTSIKFSTDEYLNTYVCIHVVPGNVTWDAAVATSQFTFTWPHEHIHIAKECYDITFTISKYLYNVSYQLLVRCINPSTISDSPNNSSYSVLKAYTIWYGQISTTSTAFQACARCVHVWTHLNLSVWYVENGCTYLSRHSWKLHWIYVNK